MSFLDFFTSKSKLKLKADDLLEVRVCPNCWGKQEWEGKFIDFVQDREKDILNHDRTAQKAFVQQFIEDQVTGIRLKSEGDRLVCPRCKTGYKIVSGKAN